MVLNWQFPSGDGLNVMSKPCLVNFRSFDRRTKNILRKRRPLPECFCCKSVISSTDIYLKATKFVTGFSNFTLYIDFFLLITCRSFVFDIPFFSVPRMRTFSPTSEVFVGKYFLINWWFFFSE